MSNGARFAVFSAALVSALAMANDLTDAVSTLPQPALEKVFWECDFRGTYGRLLADEGAICVAVTSELNQRWFGDNYEMFLSWWRENKPGRHGQLEAAEQLARAGGRGG